nr:phosphoserine phosphatase [Hymenolepis microstoma]
MEGKMSSEESLARQLKEMGLTKGILKAFLDYCPLKLTDGIERLVASLRANKIDIYLISGDIFDLVVRVAKRLGIPEDHVYANRLIYDTYGAVIDFDRKQPISHSAGKAEVVASLKSKLSPDSGVLVIGARATDVAAFPPADTFIGFGGIYEIQKVKDCAKYYFYSTDEIHRFLKDTALIR